MTAVSREHETPLEQVEYSVTALSDRSEIRSILEPNRAYSAYALAQLDPALFPRNRWYLSSGPSSRALLVHSKSSLGNALFAIVTRPHSTWRFHCTRVHASHSGV
jgi:hypothetical protein